MEPIPGWKSPSSVQMSVVSNFFKLSMLLRNIHTQLTEEHGIPYWGSYLIFAVATIVIGAVLGLVLVFLIDCFYPAKVAPKKAGDGAARKKHDDLPQEPVSTNTRMSLSSAEMADIAARFYFFLRTRMKRTLSMKRAANRML